MVRAEQSAYLLHKYTAVKLSTWEGDHLSLLTASVKGEINTSN